MFMHSPGNGHCDVVKQLEDKYRMVLVIPRLYILPGLENVPKAVVKTQSGCS